MPLDTRELLQALPADVDAEPSSHAALQDLLVRLSTKPVPVGALHRCWAMGSIQAKIAVAYLAYWVRSGFATKDENERRLNETHLNAAIKLLGGMGYMRGMMMKFGQMLAGYPEMVPSQFAEILGQLHFDAPPMHYSLIREHLYNELGADPEELFAEFETRAFAAASLGQVHRATLPTGERVAVKVQYPNIARTINTDFRNMMALLLPMRLSKDWDNIRVQWDDIRQMLEWETDYEREAKMLERVRAIFGSQDAVAVPRTYEAFSTKRVLTMEYLDGVHLGDYLSTDPSQPERNRYGAWLMRASFRIGEKARLWYADSNPGNYLFLRDGRLGLLDFGCCRELAGEELDYYKEICRATFGDEQTLRRALLRAIDVDPDKPHDPDHIQLLKDLFGWYNKYITTKGEFDFADPVMAQRGLDLSIEAMKKGYFRSRPLNTWINRHLMGVRAILFRLGACIDVRTIVEEECPDFFGESQ